MWRYHRIWLELEADEYGGLSAARLLQMVERLPAYGGVLSARAFEESQRNESGQVVQQVTPAAGAGTVMTVSGVPVKAGAGISVEQIGSTQAELATHPAMAGLFDMVTVPAP